MKVEAIKHVAACACAGLQPSKSEQADALAEVVDVALEFFANVARMADALDRMIPADPDPSNP